MSKKCQVKLTKFRYRHMLPSRPIFTPPGQVSVNYLENSIAEFRETEGISQYHLAYAIKISRQALHNIENGKAIPSVLVALRLARYFEVSVEELFKTGWTFMDKSS